jgi:hypothetical protein
MSWAPSRGLTLWLKGPQGWVQCEDRLPYYKGGPGSCSLSRPHDPTTREDLGGGARGPGPARVGLVTSMQREGDVPDSLVQNKMTKALSTLNCSYGRGGKWCLNFEA